MGYKDKRHKLMITDETWTRLSEAKDAFGVGGSLNLYAEELLKRGLNMIKLPVAGIPRSIGSSLRERKNNESGEKSSQTQRG